MLIFLNTANVSVYRRVRGERRELGKSFTTPGLWNNPSGHIPRAKRMPAFRTLPSKLYTAPQISTALCIEILIPYAFSLR
jgi:hypothetical protein